MRQDGKLVNIIFILIKLLCFTTVLYIQAYNKAIIWIFLYKCVGENIT